MSDAKLERIALLAELVKQAPAKLGRTAIMKLMFFLKVLRNVPLPYDFRLYTYGPFDSDVLGDLAYAEALDAVRSAIVAYPGGYGYEYSAGPQAARIEEHDRDLVEQHRESIRWVLERFGHRSAVDLEMASTLVYIDRQKPGTSIPELAKKVSTVKPHLTLPAIEREARTLKEQALLTAA